MRSLGDTSSSFCLISGMPMRSCHASLATGVVAAALKEPFDAGFRAAGVLFSLLLSSSAPCLASGTHPSLPKVDPSVSTFEGWKLNFCSLFFVASDIATSR